MANPSEGISPLRSKNAHEAPPAALISPLISSLQLRLALEYFKQNLERENRERVAKGEKESEIPSISIDDPRSNDKEIKFQAMELWQRENLSDQFGRKVLKIIADLRAVTPLTDEELQQTENITKILKSLEAEEQTVH
jgi:hypothetical protein